MSRVQTGSQCCCPIDVRRVSAGVLADAGILVRLVDMHDSLSELPQRRVDVIQHSIDPGDGAPASRHALRAAQLRQLLVDQHLTGRPRSPIGRLVGHASGFELLTGSAGAGSLFAVALDLLLVVRSAKQLALAGSAVSAWRVRRLH